MLTWAACRSPGVVVVVDRDGQFYPPALAAWGVPLERLIVVRAAADADALWAADQALRTGHRRGGAAAAAVWFRCDRLAPHDFRRLKLSAEEGGSLDVFERTAKFGPVIVIPGNGKTQFQPILREDAARCVVEAIGKPDLLGKIVELGGPEVVTFETMYDWFLQARKIKKPKLHLMPELLIPGAAVMELLLDDPLVTPDEIRSSQLANVADGLDSVTAHFGWRPSPVSSWAPINWQVKRR